jgi:hypothetical protein
MSSHTLHMLRVRRFGLSFLSQSLRPVLSNSQSCLSLRLDDLNFDISISVMLLFVSLSLLQDLSSFTLGFPLSQEFLVFSLDDLNRLVLHSIDLSLLLLSLLNNLLVKEVDLFHIVVMLKFEHNLHVVSFQFE